MTMRITHKPIAQILKADFLEVPTFHRSYVWTEKNVRQLLDDVRCMQGEPFIGTVVTSDQDESHRLRVIDGQQRLATVSLMMAAARDQFAEKDVGEKIIGNLTPFIADLDLALRLVIPKLRMSDQDGVFFHNRFIVGDSSVTPKRDSHRRLVAADALIRAEIAQTPDRELWRWVEFLQTRLMVSHVEADRKANACALFEALNDPESELTQSELATLAFGFRPAVPGATPVLA